MDELKLTVKNARPHWSVSLKNTAQRLTSHNEKAGKLAAASELWLADRLSSDFNTLLTLK
jgi:hypothetical protein